MSIQDEINMIRMRLLNRNLARFDDDDGGDDGDDSTITVGHGNTRLPFGLCKANGIKIEDSWTPSDAWDALKGKGISSSAVFKAVKAIKDDNDKAIQNIKNATGNYAKKQAARTYIDTLEDGDTIVIGSGKNKRKITVKKDSSGTMTFEENTANGTKTRDADRMAMHLVNCVEKFKKSVKTKKADLNSKVEKSDVTSEKSEESTETTTNNNGSSLPPLEDEPDDIYANIPSWDGVARNKALYDAISRYKVAKDSGRLNEYKGNMSKMIMDINPTIYTTVSGGYVTRQGYGYVYIPTKNDGTYDFDNASVEDTLSEELARKLADNLDMSDDGSLAHVKVRSALRNYSVGAERMMYKSKKLREAYFKAGNFNYHRDAEDVLTNMEDGEALKIVDGSGAETYIEKKNGKFTVYGNKNGVNGNTWAGGAPKSVAMKLYRCFGNSSKCEAIDSSSIPASAKVRPKPKPKPKPRTTPATVVTADDITSTYQRKNPIGLHVKDVAKQQGFDGLPQVVGADEFRSALYYDTYICARGDSCSSCPADVVRSSLYSGEFHMGGKSGTVHGTGLYGVSCTKKNSTGYDSVVRSSHFGQKEVWTFDPSTKFIDEDDLKRMYFSEPDDVRQKFPINSTDRYSAYGAAKGYDVITTTHNYSWGSKIRTPVIVVLNRTKMVILKPEERDSYRQNN